MSSISPDSQADEAVFRFMLLETVLLMYAERLIFVFKSISTHNRQYTSK